MAKGIKGSRGPVVKEVEKIDEASSPEVVVELEKQRRSLTIDLLKTLVLSSVARTGASPTEAGIIELVNIAKAATKEL